MTILQKICMHIQTFKFKSECTNQIFNICFKNNKVLLNNKFQFIFITITSQISLYIHTDEFYKTKTKIKQ